MNVESDQHRPRRAIKRALIAWLLVTVAAVAQVLLLVFFNRPGLDRVLLRSHLSDYHVTLMAVLVCWLVPPGLLLVALRRRTNWTTIATAITTAGVVLLYANALRERQAYGDYHVYLAAASSLHSGEPLPDRYLYSPLWAMLLEPLVPFGWRALFDAIWLGNIAGLAVLHVLLIQVLRRYGYSTVLAIALATGFIAVNVPILRTLGYMQVNLHALNGILASLLLHPTHRAGSALALAVASALKLSPAGIAIAFVLARDWRWVAWFIAGTLLIAGAMVAIAGTSPFTDLVRNLANIYAANPLAYRDTSIDSLVRATSALLGSGGAANGLIISGAKLIAIVACLGLSVRAIKQGRYVSRTAVGADVLNAVPAAFALMVLIAPLMWEHHAVFMAMPMLLMLRQVWSPAAGLLFGAAYWALFLMPTIDIYPWSYARLASVALWLVMTWRSGYQRTDTAFATLERRIASALGVIGRSFTSPQT